MRSSCRESVSIRIWGISPRWGTRPCARGFTMAKRVQHGELGRVILSDATVPAHECSSVEYRQMIRRGTVRIGELDAFFGASFSCFTVAPPVETPTLRTKKIAGRMLLRYFSYLSLLASRFSSLFSTLSGYFLRKEKASLGTCCLTGDTREFSAVTSPCEHCFCSVHKPEPT